ncbi:MAG TPA: hypothetical protein VK188_10305 [Holophaga sp.]|nr:hypothetical protein [Holophaga sp.]
MPILRTLLCAALAAPLLPAQDRRACVEACMRAWNDAIQACVDRWPEGSAERNRCLFEAISERNRCVAACPENRSTPALDALARGPLPFRWVDIRAR